MLGLDTVIDRQFDLVSVSSYRIRFLTADATESSTTGSCVLTQSRFRNSILVTCAVIRVGVAAVEL